MSQLDQNAATLLVLLGVWLLVRYRRRRFRAGWAHGTSRWADKRTLWTKGFFGKKGLLLGRTLRRRLLRLPKYTHVQVVAPTGAGKGVSFVIPTLLTYTKGSVFVFDPKGELFKITSKRRKGRVIRVDPYRVCGPGGDTYNPLLEIFGSEFTADDCRALADAMVVQSADARDPFWRDSAVMLIAAFLLAAVQYAKPEFKTLASMRELLCDPEMFKATVERLQKEGGIAGRMGGMLAKQMTSEKEMAGVLSTAHTHTSFADSEAIAVATGTSTFSANVLLQPGTTIYFILPVEMILAMQGYLRLSVSALMRYVMRHGVKNGGESLWILDECALLANLDCLKQAFVLGRGKGIKLLTFWQSSDQCSAAFKETPNLVADNSDAKIFFGVNSLATAKIVSESLGNWTVTTTSINESTSRSRPTGGHQDNRSVSHSETVNTQEISRPLLNASEVLQLSPDLFIGFFQGLPPLLGRRLLYYRDPIFRRSRKWVAVLVLTALAAWGLLSR